MLGIALQAWTVSVYGCLPSSAQVYAGTVGMFGCKSPLRRLDGLHCALAGALGLVSAALGFYVMKGHRLQKQVNSNSTELSRLLLKVSSAGPNRYRFKLVLSSIMLSACSFQPEVVYVAV